MSTICRFKVVFGVVVLAVAFLANAPELRAQSGTKSLKLRNQDSNAVEYGLSGLGARAPSKTWLILPGGNITLTRFFTPDHQVFWWRLQGERVWQSAVVPANPSPVYLWRFLGGQEIGGKPRAELTADPENR